MATTLRRPSSYDEGVAQLRKAVQDTPPNAAPSATPRGMLWAACDTLVRDERFVRDGLRTLYDANQVVSFLFHTIVPHLEERLRFTKLQTDYDAATRKPENVAQNAKRFDAIVAGVVAADEHSCRNLEVDAEFARMRDAMRPISRDAGVVAGLRVLYVSSKVGRKSIDLIFQRLIDAFQNDTRIVTTTEIPLEAMFM